MKIIYKINPENGDLMDKYRGRGQASEENGVSASAIGNCLNGRQVMAGGFWWCYEENYEDGWVPKKVDKYKNECPKCGRLKDARSKMCKHCANRVHEPVDYDTAVEWACLVLLKGFKRASKELGRSITTITSTLRKFNIPAKKAEMTAWVWENAMEIYNELK